MNKDTDGERRAEPGEDDQPVERSKPTWITTKVWPSAMMRIAA